MRPTYSRKLCFIKVTTKSPISSYLHFQVKQDNPIDIPNY
jgi:hypothetical protein